MKLVLVGLIVQAFCIQAFGQQTAKLLTSDFNKVKDVCEDARKATPKKKAALVLLKTHNCDATSNVCINSLSTLTDPANVFVNENFATYQTRFNVYVTQEESLDGLLEDYFMKGKSKKFVSKTSEEYMGYAGFEGEKQIRDSWNKRDSNPEVAVLDLKTCEVLGRKYLKDIDGAFSIHFETRYAAMRRAILDIPGVAPLLGEKYLKPETLSLELAQIQVSRIVDKQPEKTKEQAFSELETETHKHHVMTTSVHAIDISVKEANAQTQAEYGTDHSVFIGKEERTEQ